MPSQKFASGDISRLAMSVSSGSESGSTPAAAAAIARPASQATQNQEIDPDGDAGPRCEAQCRAPPILRWPAHCLGILHERHSDTRGSSTA